MMYRLNPSEVLFSYDGELEGFFSLVFHAYARHTMPSDIMPVGAVQPRLGQVVEEVQTNMEHAERVRLGLTRCAGYTAFDKVKRAFLSDQPGRELALLRYVERAMNEGHRIHRDTGSDEVAAVDALVRRVANECEKMQQFARFECLENGVYFARVNPAANVVYLVMDHFVERFSTHAFILYDEVHHVAGVYDRSQVSFVKSDEVFLPDKSEDEARYQQLWKAFYDAVSNDQRYNPDLRRSFMPKRFWKNITEMSAAASPLQVA